jgi:cytoskeleton protein RodZ
MESLGEWLREEREARSVSIEEIASATKIVPRYLEALESDRLDLMPGGFFIKGIIRAYAGAVGLDAEEVLARYKAAGLLGGGEGAKKAPRRPGPEAAPRASPIPPPPPEITLPSDEVPASESAAPAPIAPVAAKLVFEEAPKPKLPPESRKRILAWTWRIVAAIAVISAIVLLWPFRGSREASPEPGTVVTPGVLPPPQTSESGLAPGSVTGQQATVEPAAAAAAEEVREGLTIEITFAAETWIRVFTDGVLKVDGLFPAGAEARARADREILIRTGNAGGFTFTINGRPAKSLGRVGQLLGDVTITADNYRDFLEDPTSAGPTA